MKLHVTARANREMFAAMVWYESKEAGLGLEFLRSFDACLHFIANHPLASPLVVGEFRRAWMRRFPYGAYFAVRSERVHVVALIHASQDPDRLAPESR